MTCSFLKLAPQSKFAVAALLLTLPLAACTDRVVTGSTIKDDYRERHRITMAERPVNLNLFPIGSGLDQINERRLAYFASEYRRVGESRLEILLPVGGANEARMKSFVPQIQAALGLPNDGRISIGTYPVADPDANSPIRLSYRTTRATVINRCGEWPADLGPANGTTDSENRPWWNFGCSYQTMLANQTDDPRDLEAPRAETPSDTTMRMRGIGRVRNGSDPATSWTVGVTSAGGR